MNPKHGTDAKTWYKEGGRRRKPEQIQPSWGPRSASKKPTRLNPIKRPIQISLVTTLLSLSPSQCYSHSLRPLLFPTRRTAIIFSAITIDLPNGKRPSCCSTVSISFMASPSPHHKILAFRAPGTPLLRVMGPSEDQMKFLMLSVNRCASLGQSFSLLSHSFLISKKEGTNWLFNQCEMAVQTVKAEQRCSIFITISTHFLLLIFCKSDPLYVLNRYPATLPLISLNGYALLPPLPVCYLEQQSIHYCSLPPLNPPK